MKAAPTGAWIAVAVLGFGLAACGGGSGGTVNTGVVGAPTETTAEEAAGATGNGLTLPGTQLGLGEQAIVSWVPPLISTGSGARKGYKLQVTVESIRKGKIADFKNVRLKASERRSTPYYVKVRVKALGNIAPAGNNDPDVAFDAVDDRGQKQRSVIFLGTFSRCDDASPPRPFARGKSYLSCLTYLMPGGGSIEKVQWGNGPATAGSVSPYFNRPIVWAGS